MRKRRLYLTEVIPPGPRAAELADKARSRLLRQVEEKRSPRTNATVGQLLDQYMDMFPGSKRTAVLCRSYIKKHIRPLLGNLKVGVLNPEVLDSFYAELRRCRDHCVERE